MKKFEIGEWVINDYEVKEVTKMEGGRVTELQGGGFCMSGYNLSCQKLNQENKCNMDSMQYWYRELSKVRAKNALNWPDIHRYFCDKMEELDGASKKESKAIWDEIKSFVDDVKTKLDSIGESHGVRVFR